MKIKFGICEEIKRMKNKIIIVKWFKDLLGMKVSLLYLNNQFFSKRKKKLSYSINFYSHHFIYYFPFLNIKFYFYNDYNILKNRWLHLSKYCLSKKKKYTLEKSNDYIDIQQIFTTTSQLSFYLSFFLFFHKYKILFL